VRIIPFEAWHVEAIELQDAQRSTEGFYTPEQLVAAGDAITVVEGETILMCGGRARRLDHWVLWALLSKHAGRKMIGLTRIVKRAMQVTSGEMRVIVHRNFKAGIRWVRILGLKYAGDYKDDPMPDGSMGLVFRSERSLTPVVKAALAAAKAGHAVDCPLENHFSEGLYARKLTIPAGTLIVGKVHKRQTLNICARGRIAILTKDGPRTFKAGDVVVSEPGIQKVGYAFEDTDWINVHATDETDLDLIEKAFVEDPRVPVDAVDFMKRLEAA
jgi:hypothetical protein